jgi:hypothetical protein
VHSGCRRSWLAGCDIAYGGSSNALIAIADLALIQ